MSSQTLEREPNLQERAAEAIAIVSARETSFAAEAIRRAEAAGFYPAEGQREVDWQEVALWAERVREAGFVWLSEREQYGTGYIILGANGAIASGQHRILGGLLGGNPVPETSCSFLSVGLPTQPWRI